MSVLYVLFACFVTWRALAVQSWTLSLAATRMRQHIQHVRAAYSSTILVGISLLARCSNNEMTIESMSGLLVMRRPNECDSLFSSSGIVSRYEISCAAFARPTRPSMTVQRTPHTCLKTLTSVQVHQPRSFFC